jgi:hypothetical protein
MSKACGRMITSRIITPGRRDSMKTGAPATSWGSISAPSALALASRSGSQSFSKGVATGPGESCPTRMPRR